MAKMNFDDGVYVYDEKPHPVVVAQYAIENNDFALMRELIEKGDISLKPDEDGNSFLHHAAASAGAEMIQLLVAMGGDMYALNENGQTPYEVAMTSGNEDGFKGFLASKIDRNAVGTTQKTLPYDVAAYGNWQMMETYLAETKTPADFVDSKGYSLLHEACKHGNINTIRTLIQKGADVNVVDDVLSTPLHYLCAYNYQTTNRRLGVETLIQLGVDVNAQNEQGLTALHLAAHVGSSAVAKQLIKEGADINVVDKKGKTALDYVNARLATANQESEQYQELKSLQEALISAGGKQSSSIHATLGQAGKAIYNQKDTIADVVKGENKER